MVYTDDYYSQTIVRQREMFVGWGCGEMGRGGRVVVGAVVMMVMVVVVVMMVVVVVIRSHFEHLNHFGPCPPPHSSFPVVCYPILQVGIESEVRVVVVVVE